MLAKVSLESIPLPSEMQNGARALIKQNASDRRETGKIKLHEGCHERKAACSIRKDEREKKIAENSRLRKINRQLQGELKNDAFQSILQYRQQQSKKQDGIAKCSATKGNDNKIQIAAKRPENDDKSFKNSDSLKKIQMCQKEDNVLSHQKEQNEVKFRNYPFENEFVGDSAQKKLQIKINVDTTLPINETQEQQRNQESCTVFQNNSTKFAVQPKMLASVAPYNYKRTTENTIEQQSDSQSNSNKKKIRKTSLYNEQKLQTTRNQQIQVEGTEQQELQQSKQNQSQDKTQNSFSAKFIPYVQAGTDSVTNVSSLNQSSVANQPYAPYIEHYQQYHQYCMQQYQQYIQQYEFSSPISQHQTTNASVSELPQHSISLLATTTNNTLPYVGKVPPPPQPPPPLPFILSQLSNQTSAEMQNVQELQNITPIYMDPNQLSSGFVPTGSTQKFIVPMTVPTTTTIPIEIELPVFAPAPTEYKCTCGTRHSRKCKNFINISKGVEAFKRELKRLTENK